MESIKTLGAYFGTQHMMNNVIHPDNGKICTYATLASGKVPNQDKNTWTTSLANEFGRLADGVGDRMPSGTNTIKFIQHTVIPKDRHVTYGKSVCDVREHKAETHWCRLTVGGDRPWSMVDVVACCRTSDVEAWYDTYLGTYLLLPKYLLRSH